MSENISSDSEINENFLIGLASAFAGVIFLAMNPASTEKIYLIAFQMSDWQIIALAVGSIIMMYAFVYNFDLKGEEASVEEKELRCT